MTSRCQLHCKQLPGVSVIAAVHNARSIESPDNLCRVCVGHQSHRGEVVRPPLGLTDVQPNATVLDTIVMVLAWDCDPVTFFTLLSALFRYVVRTTLALSSSAAVLDIMGLTQSQGFAAAES